MCSMKMLEHTATKRRWDDHAVLIHDDTILNVEGVPKGPVLGYIANQGGVPRESALHWRTADRDGSPDVSSASSDHEMTTIASASRWTAATRTDLMWSGMPASSDAPPTGWWGWRQVALAARFVAPGRYLTANRHGSVLCSSRKSGVLAISSRVRSPKIRTRGLWSVTTRRLSHPCVRKRVCSRPYAIASASPSTAG